MSDQPRTARPRFVFVDALRGIAALAVVVFHVYAKNLVPITGYRFPEPLHSVFANGNMGVYVFFVISGFVIAQSIRGEQITARYVGWFAARRSLRLDPPYWATMIAMIALLWVSRHIQHERSLPMPTAGSVLAHLFYVQSFLGYSHIVGVFWTLCYEIQFYLVLVLLVGAAQRLGRAASQALARWIVFVPVWLVALAVAAGMLDTSKALFLHAWTYFFLGVIVNWTYHADIDARVLPLALLSAAVIAPAAPVQLGVAAATALAIYVVGRMRQLEPRTLGRGLQYLGRISYSLYLVHMLVGTPLFRFGLRLLGHRPDALHAAGLMLLATAVSILAAHVFYVCVERPAMQLSHKLRRFRGMEATPS